MALTKVKGHIIADDLALGGNPTTSTQSTGNNTTRLATTAFVQTELSALVDSSPSALNTLNELAAALGDDANFSTTITNSIATKLPLAGGTLTGALTINSGTANTGLAITSTDEASWLTMTDPTASLFFGNTAGNYAVYTGGTESMKIDTTGKLSIGGATPQGNLTIKGAASDDIDLLTFSEDGTNQSFSFNGNFAGSGVSGNNLTLDSYWTNDIMSWRGGGQVGIGIAVPVSKLHVVSANVGVNGAVAHILQNVATNGPTLLVEQTGGGGNSNVNHGLLVKVDGQNGGLGNAFQVVGTNNNLNSGNDIKALTVKNGGNVGIGTDAPSAPLHITHGTPSIKFTDSSSSANYSMTLDGVTVNNTNAGTNGSIAFHTHNGEKLRLGATYSYFSNTNVGIGTTTPTMGLLQVHGSKYVNTNSGKALGGIHVSPDSAATLGQFGGAISFSAGGNGSSAIAAVNDGGTDNDSTGLAFFVHGSGTGSDDATEVVRIDQLGNVGIKQTDPATTLHIGDGASHYVRIENAGSGDVSSGYQIYRGSSVGMSLYDNPQDNTTSLLCAGSLNINAGGSGADLHVNANGNVGIGNTNPSRALLHVGGNGIALNTSTDVSKTAIIRTSGSGNYSSSGNDSAAHALTLMRGNNAADGDQVGLSFVLDNGNWSATSEIMAEVEQASSANTRLNFKTWNASGAMRTTQYITSEGQVVKPYQSGFYAVKSSAQTVSVNDKIVFNTATENVGADYNNATGVYTAPISGFYIFAYTVLFGAGVPNDIDIDHYLGTSNRAYIGGMPGRIRYLSAGATGWGDGYVAIGHTQIAYMDAGDTAYVYCSALTNSSNSQVSLTAYANTGNNWSKFSGYFLG